MLERDRSDLGSLAATLCIVPPLCFTPVILWLAMFVANPWLLLVAPFLFGYGLILVRRYRALIVTIGAAAGVPPALWVAMQWWIERRCVGGHDPYCGLGWALLFFAVTVTGLLAIMLGSAFWARRVGRGDAGAARRART